MDTQFQGFSQSEHTHGTTIWIDQVIFMGRNLREFSVQFVCSSGSLSFTDFLFTNAICWVVPTAGEIFEAPPHYFVLIHFR